MAASTVLGALFTVGIPLTVNLVSDEPEAPATTAPAVPPPSPTASTTTAESEEPSTPAPTTAQAEAPTQSAIETTPAAVEAVYEGATLTLEPPELGYDHATLIEFDGDKPSLPQGAVQDVAYDMYYDHEFQNEPSAYFRLHSEAGVLLGHGPDTMPEGPDECAEAVIAEPMPDYLPQPDRPLERGSGYCLRTDEGNIVWFNVIGLSGEAKNYKFTLLVTLWPGI